MHPTDRNDLRPSQFTVNRPPRLSHFYKIILATTVEQKKLRIPYKFVKRFGDELTDVADLIVPNGSVWKVGLSKARNSIWFDDGWQKFAEHHSIGYGHFLVFAYTGFCTFNVFIFDPTASEIEYPHNNEDVNGVEMQDDNPSEMLNSTSATTRDSSETYTKLEPKLRMKRSSGAETACTMIPDFEHLDTRNKKPNVEVEHLVEKIDIDDSETRRKKLDKGKPHISELDEPLADKQKCSRSTSRSGESDSAAECEEDKEIEIVTSNRFERIKATPESKRAIRAARMYMPKNPSFMAVLTAANSQYNRLYMPMRFTRFLNKALHRIKLQVSDGREWEVHLLGGNYKRRDLGLGWSTFCRDNNLDKGDVCVFELMENKKVLKVSIFRAIRDGRHES